MSLERKLEFDPDYKPTAHLSEGTLVVWLGKENTQMARIEPEGAVICVWDQELRVADFFKSWDWGTNREGYCFWTWGALPGTEANDALEAAVVAYELGMDPATVAELIRACESKQGVIRE